MDQDATKMKFCPGCGENVHTYVVDKGMKSSEGHPVADLCCIFCVMPVEEISSKTVIPVNEILIADDSAMIRELLKDLLIDEKLAKHVTNCDHGSDFLTTFTEKAVAKEPAALIVLDVAMPILNGVNAAIAARSIEKALKLKPTPIMFFTSQKCDENFKKVLSYCKLYRYLNKGVSSTPDMLTSRMRQVVIQLLKERQELA